MSGQQIESGRWSQTVRYKLLFGMLLSTLIASPLLPDATIGAIVYEGFIAFMLVSSLFAIASSRHVALVGLALAVPAVAGGLVRHWIELPLMAEVLTRLAGAGVMAITTYQIVKHVSRVQRVTQQMIFGAMSAYLLVGFVASALFSAMGAVDPQTINIPASVLTSAALDSSYLYFSFVTLTTLGYGDITPATPMARSLAMLVAVTGQLFVAVMLARVVALYVSHSTTDNTSE